MLCSVNFEFVLKPPKNINYVLKLTEKVSVGSVLHFDGVKNIFSILLDIYCILHHNRQKVMTSMTF